MNMEHRLHQRVSVCKQIDVEYPGGKTIAGTIRDISSGGVFVELCTTNLPPHGLVRLRIPSRHGAQEPCIPIPAAVTRRTRKGVGLLYCGSFAHIREHIRAWFESTEPVWRAASVSRGPARVARAPESGLA